MRILGISAFYHDSAAALLEDGDIVGRRAGRALHPQEARCGASRRTPSQYCLDRPASRLQDVDYVVFYDKPFLKFERLLETYLAFAPRGFRSFRMAMPVWLKEKLFQKMLLRDELKKWRARTSTGRSACCSPSTTRATRPGLLPVALRARRPS